jgi:uncharacterized Zn-binding protein involved in type VI secretion
VFNLIGSICVGDRTSCGGTVATGTPTTDVNGRSVARIGDRIACKYHCAITTGNPTEIIDGSPMALHGSQTSRGCTCLSSNNNFHGDKQTAEAAAAVPSAADAGIAYMPETADVLNEDHWVEFQLVNANGEPLAYQSFTLTDPAGTTFSGTLNESGYVKVSPVKAGLCSVQFPELNYSISVTA